MPDVDSKNSPTDLDSATAALRIGASKLQQMRLEQCRELIDACANNISSVAQQWVDASCAAKQIPITSPTSAEDILVGPVGLLRYLRLMSKTFLDVQRKGQPQLPGRPTQRNGRTQAPVLPVRGLFDQLVFMGLKAEVWLNPGCNGQVSFSNLAPANGNPADPSTTAPVAGVLGAGNVSAIPATDMLHKIFVDRESVLLKLNPVNEYLQPIFTTIFQPLIDAQLLNIVCGSSDVGAAIVQHSQIDTLHITGSHHTHDAIVWGSDPVQREQRIANSTPLIDKPITSELGNVTPWIIVPGKYSKRQLESQARHLVASIVNNASFNCVATKMIVTSNSWQQRKSFLDLVETLLKQVPQRHAYYPGAKQRFASATGKPVPQSDDGALPWTLVRNATREQSPHLFDEESFVCVCAETVLSANTDIEFLKAAVEFANENLFGTLCATLTVPHGFQKNSRMADALNDAIGDLRYGAVCINQWAGIVYGLMTPPWGGHPSGTLESPQSGLGHVHNTFNLKGFEKTVLWGPLCNFPKPVWFASHRTSHRAAWALFELYDRPSILRLPKLFYHALLG